MKKHIRIILVFSILCSIISCSKSSSFSIKYLNVGQGDAALIECDGHYMMIDGGPSGSEMVIRSVLRDNSVKKLDYLIISHAHKDHYYGISEVMNNDLKIKKVLCNTNYSENASFDVFKDRLKKDIIIPEKGKKYKFGSALINIILVGNPKKNKNDSIVLTIEYSDKVFLFTGDMSVDQQTEFSNKYFDDEHFECDIIKIPHHGSINDDEKTSSAFLDSVNAKYAIISAGEQYNHPNKKMIDMLDQSKTKYYITKEVGNIEVTVNNGLLEIKTNKY
ncbi:ComEC/Rec2 family competence protein [Floccifex sp.]|uniref:ComEC/Rec2 family competence protein n=1 Tax=Floccifex sp. TaxID=2815810 RepID=UPI003EFCF736